MFYTWFIVSADFYRRINFAENTTHARTHAHRRRWGGGQSKILAERKHDPDTGWHGGRQGGGDIHYINFATDSVVCIGNNTYRVLLAGTASVQPYTTTCLLHTTQRVSLHFLLLLFLFTHVLLVTFFCVTCSQNCK